MLTTSIMEKFKKIIQVNRAMKINMGGIILDQALPLSGLEQVDPFLLIHHWNDRLKGDQEQSEVGVGPHPHRGFSPVTLIFVGSVHHRDSMGNNEVVEKGGTQWMNSGSGLVHSERPSMSLAKEGGKFEIIQFWVNSPSNVKMKEPSYQPLSLENTKRYENKDNNVSVDVVSGSFKGLNSTIESDSPMTILRIEFYGDGEIEIPLPDDYNTLLYILDGDIKVNKESDLSDKDMAVFKKEEGSIFVQSKGQSRLIILSGKPIEEEVSTYGPFVMNTHDEILKAIDDYQNGRMGTLVENF